MDSRRDFIKKASGAALLAQQVIAQTSSASATGVPTRVLGRTGERVSIICLGGWHVGSIKDEGEAIRLITRPSAKGSPSLTIAGIITMAGPKK